MRVLIVDDTIVYRSMLKMILAEVEGIEVVGVAGNGSIALQKVEQRHVDLMILDIDRKSTRLNSSHSQQSRMPSSA